MALAIIRATCHLSTRHIPLKGLTLSVLPTILTDNYQRITCSRTTVPGSNLSELKLFAIVANYCVDAESNGCHPREEVPEGFDEIRSWMGPAPSLYVWDVGPNSSIPDTQCPDCELGVDGRQFKITSFDVSVTFCHNI